MARADTMTLRKALRDLFARKLRTLLVVLSVAVGVFGISAIRIAGEQIERGSIAQFGRANAADLTYNGQPLDEAKRRLVQDTANVERVEGRLIGQARWKPPSRTDRQQRLDIQGVTRFGDSNSLDVASLTRGRDQQEASEQPKAGEILFEKSARRAFDLKVGDMVTVVGADKEERTYKVSGFAENANVPAVDRQGHASAWLNRDDAAKLL